MEVSGSAEQLYVFLNDLFIYYFSENCIVQDFFFVDN